jgi:septin family protein
MKYLILIFIIIIVAGIFANRELARDKKRIKQMLKEYSFKTYSPEDEEESHSVEKVNEKKS